MSIQEMKEAVAGLPPDELAEFAAWLDAYREQAFDAWDRQMQADAEAGKFDSMIEEARNEHRAGRTTPLP
jgi:hypothetical protein